MLIFRYSPLDLYSEPFIHEFVHFSAPLICKQHAHMVIEIEIYNATDDSWLRSEPLIMIANQSKPFTVVQMVISCIAMEREKNNPILPLKSFACHRRNLCLPLREKWEGEIGHSNRKLLPLLCSVKISLSFSRFLIPLPLDVIFMWAVCERALSLKQRKVNAFFIIIFFYFISMHLCPSCTSTKQTRKSGLISLDISNIQDLKRGIYGLIGWSFLCSQERFSRWVLIHIAFSVHIFFGFSWIVVICIYLVVCFVCGYGFNLWVEF